MNPLQAIAASYKRRRHSLGFGVHSPAAYNFVRDILMDRRGYSYYMFDALEARCTDTLQRRRARMLHRLAARYRCHHLEIDPTLPQAWREAITTAHTADYGTGTIIVTRGLRHNLPPEGITVMFDLDANQIADLTANLSGATALIGHDAAIVISHPSIRPVTYTVII